MVMDTGVSETYPKHLNTPNIGIFSCNRVKEVCRNSGRQIAYHFEGILEMIRTEKTT